MLKLELADDLLVTLEDGDREAEDSLHSFGKDEVEHGAHQFKRESIAVPPR